MISHLTTVGEVDAGYVATCLACPQWTGEPHATRLKAVAEATSHRDRMKAVGGEVVRNGPVVATMSTVSAGPESPETGDESCTCPVGWDCGNCGRKADDL
jgi:hypothetical protein